jgi:CheY-like chemotaxis protein
VPLCLGGYGSFDMAEEHLRILIVEDDEGNALLAEDALSDYFTNCSVDIAASGKACLERLRGNGKYDAMLLDQNLPDAKGTAMKLGAYDYIVKTADLGYLKMLPLAVEKSIEKRNMETQLEEARKKEIELERLRAVQEIAISLSHEINNPLTSIMGMAQLLLMIPEKFDEESIAQLKWIEDSAKRIAHITRKLNELKRLEVTSYVGKDSMIDIEHSVGDSYNEQ